MWSLFFWLNRMQRSLRGLNRRSVGCFVEWGSKTLDDRERLETRRLSGKPTFQGGLLMVRYRPTMAPRT